MRRIRFAADRRRPLVVTLVSLVLAGTVVAAALAVSGGASTQSASAKDREIARLKAELARAQLAAKLWNQLVTTFKPAKSPGSMSDHYLLRLPGGPVMALHMNNMSVAKATNLNWVALAVPGEFTRAEQDRVNRLYGPGFTHFHDLKKDVHGGPAGTPGVWFAHVGARNFTSPFGNVKKGQVDPTFMPTKPPR